MLGIGCALKERSSFYVGGRLDGKHNVILPRRFAFLHLRSVYKVHINLPVLLTSVGGIKPNRLCVAIKYHLAASTFLVQCRRFLSASCFWIACSPWPWAPSRLVHAMP